MKEQTVALQQLTDAVKDIAASVKHFIGADLVRKSSINIIITTKTEHFNT